ncbi:hypothetical protein [Novosphingobium sp. JCM 18896]|uniref:hypothetical protein n=1 Tax=Novosphingobium sp. JCM 18896 TaxID=2989731 RepID=UPI0022230FAE|nr:hypothetical protein [Novosphingobium sp. JCM 18896]MCW1432005.1 hypothetical protein [Novosphingobium sp. JCM 18896]
MKDFAITSQRDFDRAAQCLRDLERFADRRAQLLASLDVGSLGPGQRWQLVVDDERIAEELAWGHLYLEHLVNMEALGSALSGLSHLAA